MADNRLHLITLVALVATFVLIASPAAAAGKGASQTMGVHSVNQCVDISAINYCFSAKEVYHAVDTPSGMWIDQINVTSACWTSVDETSGDVLDQSCTTTHEQYHVDRNDDVRVDSWRTATTRDASGQTTCLFINYHEANGAIQRDIRTTAC